MTRWSVLGLLLALQSCGPLDGRACGSEQLNAADVRHQLSLAQSRIKSFYAVFEITSAPNTERPLGDILHREVGALTPAYVLHVNAHGNKEVPWSDDLRCQRTLMTPSAVLVDWTRWRAFQRWNWDYAKASSLPGSLPLEPLFKSTGLWPLDSRLAIKSSTGVPYALPLIAQDSSYSAGDPATVAWAGRECYILFRKGFDKLWLDSRKEWALVRRELYAAHTDRCIERFELSDHVEVRPMIWLPKTIRHIRFDPDRSGEEQSRVLTEYVCTVLSWRINDLAPESFVLARRPGELWLNPPENVPRQVTEGGEDYLDEVAAWVIRNGFSRSTVRQSATWLDVPSVGALLIAGTLIALAKRKSKDG
jgi:hypothetical protein